MGLPSIIQAAHEQTACQIISDGLLSVTGREEPTSGELTDTSFAPGVGANIQAVSSYANRFFLSVELAHRHAQSKSDEAKPDIACRRSTFRATTAAASQAL
jgi:hypothetical protein